MISFAAITKLFSVDLKNKMCIEIEFNIVGFEKYQYCWMGKMPDQTKKKLFWPLLSKRKALRDIYWFGLAADGTAAYDYDNFQDFATAPVFDGKSLEEIWENVELLSIDGCDPEERMQFYNSIINPVN